MIYTDDKGVPFPRPERDQFEAGSKGDVLFIRARNKWRQDIAQCANDAFDHAWRAAMRPTKRKA